MKKKKNSTKWFILIGILILAGAIVFLAFKLPQMQMPEGLNLTDFDEMEQTSTLCTINLDSRYVCEGDTVVGTLSDGDNARCVIAENYNDMGWTAVGTITTNANGKYTQAPTVGVAGDYVYAALCLDESFKVCRTNDAYLTVLHCDGPDSDGDGWPDDAEEEAGTDPDNPNDYPGGEDYDSEDTYTCGADWDNYCEGTCPTTYPDCVEIFFDAGDYYACACINEELEEIHPDWKPDGQYHNPVDEGEDVDEGFCFDNDFHLGFPTNLMTASNCQDSSGIIEDYCDSSDLIRDVFCDGNVCRDTLIQGCEANIPGSDCIDGACKTIGMYCGDLGYNRHWDTPNPGNCGVAAENYCGEGAYAFEYNYEHLWCCYKCI